MTGAPMSTSANAPAGDATPTAAQVTGIVLAGGQGRRMGGVDKGLQEFRGKPMVQWVLERLQPQVGELLINANQNLERYRAFGFEVVADEVGDFAGPLAGLHRGMMAAHQRWVATVPCDSPFLPADLVDRLAEPFVDRTVDLAVARTGNQPHPVFCLARRRLLSHLDSYLDRGGRKIDAWYATLNVVEVAFDDEADAFGNFNTLEELKAAERAPR
jgi:molybdopterin-guanine dinucleotide biosynthesis protein A